MSTKTLISYYDLLTLLKDKKQPKEVMLHYNDKMNLTYKWDAENGYIVKDAKKYFRSEKIKNYFDFYLSDTFLDRERFKEKIEILD
jgi:hypothetical protein